MKYKIFPVVCSLIVALPLLAAAQKFSLAPTTTVPGATGVVNVGRDGNGNTSVKIHVDHLAKASQLTPAQVTYVAWAEVQGRPAANLGALTVGNDRTADLNTLTTLRDFRLVITAESNPQVAAPSGQVVLQAMIHQ